MWWMISAAAFAAWVLLAWKVARILGGSIKLADDNRPVF